jgi:hypothetical protein
VPGQVGWSLVGVYDPRGSAAGGMLIEFEQLVEAALGGVEVGEHAAGARASALGGVEQGGFFDAGEGGQEFSHAQ